MKVTELTQELLKEIQEQEKQSLKVKSEVASLKASIQILERERSQKASALLNLEVETNRKQETLKSMELKRTEMLATTQAELEALKSSYQKKIQDLQKESELYLQKKQEEAQELEKKMELDLEALKSKKNLLERKETDLAEERAILYGKDEIISEKRLEIVRLEKDYDAKFKDLSIRESSYMDRIAKIEKTELSLQDRKETLLTKEREVQKMQDYLTSCRDEAVSQSKRAGELADSYERRLGAFQEKERALKIREIRLDDRESVALSHGIS